MMDWKILLCMACIIILPAFSNVLIKSEADVASYDKDCYFSLNATFNISATDFWLHSINLSNDDPTDGETISITAYIGIDGNISSVDVAFYIDEILIGIRKPTVWLISPSIPPLRLAMVSINWRAIIGEHTIKVIVDPNNSINETNEENNVGYKNVTVRGKADMLIITNHGKLYRRYGSKANQIIDKINKIATLQNGTILYTDGYDLPLEILGLIKRKVEEMPWLRYLMIVGGEEIIPFWQLNDPTGDDKYILSDYYYSDINFDGFTDLSVGRIVGDEANDIISLLDVSREPYNSWNALVAGNKRWIEYTEKVANLLEQNGLEVERLYGNWQFLLPFKIQDRVLIYHNEHANWWVWGPFHLLAFEIQLFGVGDTHPIINSLGCYAGLIRSWMGDWSSIPLAFIDEGAVAYIGGTGSQPVGYSDLLGEFFIKELLEGKDIGTALKNAKTKLLETSMPNSYVKKVILQHTLYGNPKYRPVLPSEDIFKIVNTTCSFTNISFFCETAGSYIHSVNVNVSISSYNITQTEDGYDILYIPNEGFIMEEGNYMLPSVSTKILLPENAELYNVILSYYNKTKLPGTYNLPIFSITTTSKDNFSQGISTSNISLYSVLAVENPNGTKTIVIQICPFEFYPDTGEVYFYNNFTFNIQYLISGIQMTNISAEKLQYNLNETITFVVNVTNSGFFNVTNLSLYTSFVSIGKTDIAPINIAKPILSLNIGESNNTIITWNTTIRSSNLSFTRSGYYLVRFLLKDAANNTLDEKNSIVRITAEANITISEIFLEQNHNITERVSPNICFNLTIAIDNLGDYNATGVIATIKLPQGIFPADNLTKNVGNISKFSSKTVKWTLVAGEVGNYSIQIQVSSINAGTYQTTYNISVAETFIYIESMNLNRGEKATTPIIIEGYKGWVWGANITMYYDKNVVIVEQIEIPNYWIWKWYRIDNKNGEIRIFAAFNNSTGILNGKIIFANITFEAVGDVGSYTPLDLELEKYWGEPYPQVKDGVVEIISIPKLKLLPRKVSIPYNSTYSFDLVIDKLPHGLAGFNISLQPSAVWQNTTFGGIVSIINVSFPEWASLHEWGTVDGDGIVNIPPITWLKAIDLNDYVSENVTNVTLATITVKPNFVANGSLNISINRLDDDNGYPIDVVIENATINVFYSLPGCKPPSDPDGDGLFEDINGNGLIDFDDVVEFFQHFEWIGKNWPVNIVDFNGNGLLDFDDIVELFEEV